MVVELQCNTRAPIANPYTSTTTTRGEDEMHNEEVIIIVLKDVKFVSPATVVLYQKYEKHITAKRANATAEAF
eukprot:15347917-Ditylum_brightwellii.AAC.1